MKRVEHRRKDLGVKRQCELLQVTRSRMYYQKQPTDARDGTIMNEIRTVYTQHPFYGYRRIHVILRRMGHAHNQKRTRRLMQLTGLQAIYPHKKTSIRNYAHQVVPYLLKGVTIDHPNQAWSVDITYIKIKGGFIYLICLIDLYSRKIMGWALSISLDTQACLLAFNNALKTGTPEIVNSDQGCQFTSDEWAQCLKQHHVLISMDGKGRWADNIYIERFWRNVKYEAVYLQSFQTVQEARTALAKYIIFYNEERPHQSLDYKTPNQAFKEYFDMLHQEQDKEKMSVSIFQPQQIERESSMVFS